MIEINTGKVSIVHELGLITNIVKLHNPQNGQEVFNVTVVSNHGTAMFATTKELLEQWILGMSKCLNELDSKIVVPMMKEVRQ